MLFTVNTHKVGGDDEATDYNQIYRLQHVHVDTSLPLFWGGGRGVKE